MYVLHKGRPPRAQEAACQDILFPGGGHKATLKVILPVEDAVSSPVLTRIETSSGVRDMARRRSSMKSRMSIGSIPEKKGEEVEDVNEDGDGGGWDEDGDAGFADPVEDMAKEPERDDERAPYWMEVGRGEVKVDSIY